VDYCLQMCNSLLIVCDVYSGVVANLELGGRSEVLFPSPPLPSPPLILPYPLFPTPPFSYFPFPTSPFLLSLFSFPLVLPRLQLGCRGAL